jgi:hypothetical protein
MPESVTLSGSWRRPLSCGAWPCLRRETRQADEAKSTQTSTSMSSTTSVNAPQLGFISSIYQSLRQ